MTFQAPARPRWLELALDYRCNLRCLGCRSCQGGDEVLPSDRALQRMKQARTSGIDRLWLGGGEPTLRPELPALLKAAKALGFRECLVQTNGMRLAYEPYRKALIEAGLSTLRFNLKSANPAIHDALCNFSGAHALLAQAFQGLQGSQVTLLGDVLLTRRTLPELTETLRHYHALGVSGFSLWLLSAHDCEEDEVRQEIPSLPELSSALTEAACLAEERSFSLESLHTPWCMLPGALRGLFRPARSWGLVIVDPSNRPFSLETSPIEGGVYPPACEGCSQRPTCPGLRADYLERHGSAGLLPVA